MRVAVVHDWLSTPAGAERVLEQILRLFPRADLFTLVDFFEPADRTMLCGRTPTTSFIQRLPGARRHFRVYLPLMPRAIERFDLSAFDLVISSSHAVAKGVITGPDCLHISYVHTPMRYAWDLQQEYLRAAGLDQGLRGWAARRLLHRLRAWDVGTANGVDHFLANSHFVARRIARSYRREATVIHPPVDVERFSLCEAKQDYYLTASRMVSYKRMDLIVRAFASMPKKKLIVIGDGPEFGKIKACAGANVELLGRQTDAVLRRHMQNARAFVFAAEDDFGIVAVEAQACGTPVIAFKAGGAAETVIGLSRDDQPQSGECTATGVFFESQTEDAIVDAVRRFEALQSRFEPALIRRHAEQFSVARFREAFQRYVDARWLEFSRR